MGSGEQAGKRVSSIGNPRSCYVVLEDGVVRFRRVEYPFDKTIAKIYAIPELDNFLGDRLRDGR